MTTENQNQQDEIVNLPVNGPALVALQGVQAWHKKSVEQINILLENCRPGITINMGQDANGKQSELVLTDEMNRGFKVALILALSLVGTLPFELTPPQEATDAEFTEVEPE